MKINILDEHTSLIESDRENFVYQKELTERLDELNGDFNQEVLNEIVLWKVNRYVSFDNEIIYQLNTNIPSIKDINDLKNRELTGSILTLLLKTKGIQLAMASTILRFKNPKVFQIIDQRVYRVLYGKPIQLTQINESSRDATIQKQIEIYVEYLIKLREKSDNHNIPFAIADRVLYNFDKRINKQVNIRQ